MKHLISTLLAIFSLCPAHGADLTTDIAFSFLKGLLRSGAEAKEGKDVKTQEPMLGTLDSHRYIWTRYQIALQSAAKQREANWRATTEWQYAEADYKTRRAPITKAIDSLQQEIAKAENEIKTDVFLTKGEFEKSVAFDARKQQAKSERNKELKFQILVWRVNLEKYEKQLARIAKPLNMPAEMRPQDFVATPFIPSTDLFFLQVEMGPYDADKEFVAKFAYNKQTVSPKEGNDSVRVFRFSGEIGGMEIPPRQAEKARASSGKKNLYAVVEADPTPAHFSLTYNIPRTPEQIARQEEEDIAKQREALHKRYGKEYSETTNSLMAFGVGILAHVLGAKDPGEYQEATAEAIRSSNENRERELRSITARPVQREDTYPGWVIDVGWTGKATPKALFEFNSDTKQWNKIWAGR